MNALNPDKVVLVVNRLISDKVLMLLKIKTIYLKLNKVQHINKEDINSVLIKYYKISGLFFFK